VTWVWSSPLKIHQEQRRQEKIQRATEDLAALRKQLEGPRPRLCSPFQIEERIESIVKRLRVTDYVRAWVIPFDRSKFLQEKPGRPGRQTRYRKETQAGLSIAYEVDEAAVEYDKKSDGMYPLLTNDRSLTPLQVLEAHNRQPTIEKRFQQAKSVHEIAPVFLKNESRIEALFFLYFLALLLQALIERELRRAMSEEGIEALAFYP
jgi:transposase